MAQRTQVVFTDDVDGSEAAGTTTFALQGVAYEVDLSKKNADKLAKALEPYIGAARPRNSSQACSLLCQGMKLRLTPHPAP